MEQEINEHVAAFGSAKGNVRVPIAFPISVDESVLITIAKKTGAVTEHEFACVMDESRSNQNGTVDKIYILKAVTPYVPPKYN